MTKGFTLLEMILVIAVVSIIGIFLTAILINNTGLFYLQNSKVDQGLHINDALASIHSDIRRAEIISSGYPEVLPIYTTSATKLVLKVPSVDSSNNIIANVFDYPVYYQDGDKLRYKFFPNSQSVKPSIDKIISFNVSQILFQYFDSSGVETTPTSAVKVRATINLKQKAGLKYLSNIATSEAFLRND